MTVKDIGIHSKREGEFFYAIFYRADSDSTGEVLPSNLPDEIFTTLLEADRAT
jgi:hypothetical protein